MGSQPVQTNDAYQNTGEKLQEILVDCVIMRNIIKMYRI